MEPRNGTAAALMAAAVLLASTSPAAAVLSDSHENPFLFTASLRLGMAASFMLITLATFRQKAMRELRSLASNPKTLLTWGPAAALLSTMDYTLYSMSTQHMNPAISVIIMETWPAMIIATATVAHRKSGRYQRLSPSRTAAAMTLATSGVTLVALSQHGDLHSTWQNSHTMATGVLLALAAAATLAPTPITIGWAEQKARKSAQACGENQGNLTLMYVGLVMALASGTGAALHGAASAASGEHFTAGKFLIPLLCGLITQGTGAMAWRAANAITDNLNLNLMLYALPLTGALWIWLLGAIQVQRLDLLILGAALTAGVNLYASTGARRNQRHRP